MDTLRRFFVGDPASRMKIDMDAEDSQSSEGSGPVTRPRRKGERKTPERPRRSAERRPHDSDLFVTCRDWYGRNCRHRHQPTGCKVGAFEAAGGGGNDTSPSSGGEGPPPPYGSRESTPGRPRRDLDPDGETWTRTTTWDSAQTATHPAAEDPGMVDHLGPEAEDHPEDRWEEHHPVDPHTEGHQTGALLPDHQVETPRTNRRERTSRKTSGNESCNSRGRSGSWSK